MIILYNKCLFLVEDFCLLFSGHTCYASPLFAQKETDFWYFRGGVNFNIDPPKGLTDGKLVEYEGFSTISDKNGNLLFYASREKAWNKNHQLMHNVASILGHWSSM
jgi:hypothetical protein